MKLKLLVLVESLVIVGLIVVLVLRMISVKTVPPLVREPESPRESTLTYRPPPPGETIVLNWAGFSSSFIARRVKPRIT